MLEMEKVNLSINKRLMDIVFERVEKPSEQKENTSALLQKRNLEGIRVESVFFLQENRISNEENILSWLKNKIQNVHVASYEKWLSYKEDENQKQDWANCPIQSKRYKEIKKMYESKFEKL